MVALQEERQQHSAALKVQRLFFDRSPIDTLTFCLLFKSDPTQELKSSVQKVIDENYYDKTVFLIENLGFCQQTEVRCENQNESLIIQKHLKKNYTELGFKVISIPPGSVEERIKLIFLFGINQKSD